MKKNILKKKILQKELEIKKIHLHQNANNLDSILNSLILEKAILKKELESLDKNPLFEKLKKFFPKKEKLICDYFKT